ncbi:hypothetical protein Rsub_04421 [Raphidocelis subcapitata]|uniref:Uncharacterized protein n=1 Tax=Raphidocelis subcapitata TaxID=307507 RepID=A0A2V0NWQ9_9CHLO|nr:hypothetical protein Rsub_04421 [Raphidocelis subcapitata]|eukprot:GBF92074.1 hypothetical protein Rsub_04421 [Raphidocelis subcapitata]
MDGPSRSDPAFIGSLSVTDCEMGCNACGHGPLTTRDVLVEITRHLDGRSVGALRAVSLAARDAVDAALPRARPARPATLGQLCGLLERLPSLQELSLASCADGALSGFASLSEAEAALSPLARLLSRMPRLSTLELPLAALLELGNLAWARAWAAGAHLQGRDGREALRAATAGRYPGAYRSLQRGPHSVLLLPGWLVNPAARRLSVTRAAGGSPIWPDDQPTCVWLEPSELTRLEALAIEHVCLSHFPPPLLQLAAAPGSALRELRLHCCQLRALPGEAMESLGRVTSLQLSGNFLKALPDAIGALTALRELDVSKNALPTLCNGLAALTALERLDASSNQLLALPRCLWRLSGLRRLALSHNWLSGGGQIGEACAAWGRLTELRLANVSDKNGALAVPAAALAERCPRLAVLDVSAQFQLEAASLAGLAACPRLRRLEVGQPLRDALRRQLPGVEVV